mgnify:CR=1 FL=1
MDKNIIIKNNDKIIEDVALIPITEEKTILDMANYIYQSHPSGEDDGNWPVWV